MNQVLDNLLRIQKELKAPKNQRNSFGGYNYRSCEDIMEAVKPLLMGCVLLVSDDIVLIGERYYVKATAMLTDGENTISNVAYAREALDKRGMDESQITGATSSYARKYALNGLFAIDDTKDADATNTHGKDKVDEFKKNATAEKRQETANYKEFQKTGVIVEKKQTKTLEERYELAKSFLANQTEESYNKLTASYRESVVNLIKDLGDDPRGKELQDKVNQILGIEDFKM